MNLPSVPRTWVGVVNKINSSSNEVQSYFFPIVELIENYYWEVSLGYMFTRLEQAHNRVLRGGAVKIHSVNNTIATKYVDDQHITRREFSRLFKNIVGVSMPDELATILRDAEKIRDRVLHGKSVTDGEKRKAIVFLIEYSEKMNQILQARARFKPFKYDQRGFAGRKNTLPNSTSVWLMKGLGFGN